MEKKPAAPKKRKPRSDRRVASDKLTQVERLVIAGFLKHGNASRAYREATGATKNSDVYSARLFARPHVRAHLERYAKALNRDAIAQSQEIQEHLTSFLRDGTVSVRERVRSADVLGKIQKLFSEKREFTGTVQHEHSIKLPSREDVMIALRSELMVNAALRDGLRRMLDDVEAELVQPKALTA